MAWNQRQWSDVIGTYSRKHVWHIDIQGDRCACNRIARSITSKVTVYSA